MLICGSTFNKQIIYIDFYIVAYLTFEIAIDWLLVRGSCVLQSERHRGVTVQTAVGDEKVFSLSSSFMKIWLNEKYASVKLNIR